MPNLNDHLTIGSIAGFGTYVLMCNYYTRKLDFGELLVCGGVGAVSGVAADILEPAIHPHHRAFGHSISFGAGLAHLARAKCGKQNADWEEFQKILLAVVIISYLCHLIADSLTPRGLPLVGLRMGI